MMVVLFIVLYLMFICSVFIFFGIEIWNLGVGVGGGVEVVCGGYFYWLFRNYVVGGFVFFIEGLVF